MYTYSHQLRMVMVMATIKNISAISWRSILYKMYMEEIRGPGENHLHTIRVLCLLNICVLHNSRNLKQIDQFKGPTITCCQFLILFGVLGCLAPLKLSGLDAIDQISYIDFSYPVYALSLAFSKRLLIYLVLQSHDSEHT